MAARPPIPKMNLARSYEPLPRTPNTPHLVPSNPSPTHILLPPANLHFILKWIDIESFSINSTQGAGRGYLPLLEAFRRKTASNEWQEDFEQPLEAGNMRKQALLCIVMTLALSWSARAGSNQIEDVHRVEDSAQIFQEIMGTPDRAIPQYLLDSAQCIAIIPSEMKFAFFLGANYGKGLVTCRNPNGWSSPVFRPSAAAAWDFNLAVLPPI